MKCLRLILLLQPVLLSATARPDDPLDRVLAHVPDDTALAVCIPRLERLAQGVAAFGRTIDVPRLAETRAAKLLKDWGVVDDPAGLDLSGPVLWTQAAGGTCPLLLLVVKSPEAWKQAVKADDLGGGLWRADMAGRKYAALCDDVLIVGDDRELVQAAATAGGKFAERFRRQAGQWLSTHEAVFYVDVPPWKPLLDIALTAVNLSMRAALAQSGATDEHTQEAMAWMLDQTDQFLRQIVGAAGGVKVGGEGLRADLGVTFQPDGSVAGYLQRVRPARRPLLRGLPAGATMLVFACAWELPPGMRSITARWTEALLPAEVMKKELGQNGYQQALDTVSRAYDSIYGYNGVVSPAPQRGGLLVWGANFTNDPAGTLRHMQSVLDITERFILPATGGWTMEVKSRRERLDAADVLVLDMAWKLPDDQARKVIEAIYGKTTTLYTAAGPQSLVYAWGPTDAAREQLRHLLTLPGEKLEDDPRVAAAGRLLSADPQAYCLLDLPRMFQFFAEVARATDTPMPPLRLTDKACPYIAGGLYLEPARIRAEVAVPAETIKVVVEAVRPTRKSAGE